jgi:hypothetical protein
MLADNPLKIVNQHENQGNRMKNPVGVSCE